MQMLKIDRLGSGEETKGDQDVTPLSFTYYRK
jgi:hypothetical protein